mgnify:CR=1 FL=1
MNRYPGFIAGLFLLVSGHLLAGEEPLIDTEEQKVMSSRSFLEAHPDMKYRTEGWLAYDEGRYEDARKLFTKAAGFGDKLSQAMLAEMAWKGIGQPVDRPLGYAWADISAERGYRQFVALREQYWRQLSDAERMRAIEIGQPLLDKYTHAVTGAALKKELRKARRYMISGRINRGADVVVPGPYGMATVIRGHDFYAEKFWNAGRYQEWVDEVWTDPPRENVDVGAPITIGAE